ncbi:hypothetical protein D3C78_1445630 [compost metagenome]
MPSRVTVNVTVTVLPRLNASTVTGSSMFRLVSLIGLAAVVWEASAWLPGAAAQVTLSRSVSSNPSGGTSAVSASTAFIGSKVLPSGSAWRIFGGASSRAVPTRNVNGFE